MALIKCRECGKEISDKAVVCPNCGNPIQYYLDSDTYDMLSDYKKKKCFRCGRDIAKRTKGEYDARLKEITALYEGVDGANVEAELTADLIGDYLFTDSDFINSLSTQKPNVFKKIYDEIKYFLKIATAGSKEARQLEKVKKAFDMAFKASAENRVSDETEYSLNEFEDGRRFVEVDQEQDRFEGHDRSEFPRIAKEIINEKFNGKVIGIDNKMFVNGRGRDEFTHPSKPIKEDYVYDAKMKASAEIDNLLDAGANLRNEADGRDGHLHENVVGGFDYYDTLFKVGDNYFKATINIANTEKGKLFKDVTKIKDVTKAIMNSYGQDPKFQFLRTSSIDSIPQNTKNTSGTDAQYSLSEDSKGRTVSPAVQKRFANSKAVDENGSLKVLYHGTPSGEFTIFDKSKGSIEGDFGSGFYFTDNEGDVETNYEGGGPDFENKVARRAEQIEAEEDIDYDEAEQRAREELYKGSNKFEVYLNNENPAIVGETLLMTEDKYLEEYDPDDFDDYDEYLAEVEQFLADDIENIVWEVEKNVDLYSTDGIADVLYNAYYEGGIEIEDLKARINELYLEDSEGNMAGNEVTRQIIESLGYDGIIDSTVSSKFSNMGLEEGTTHYIVFKPNQIKSITNQNPTDNPDINLSLSGKNDIAPVGKYNVYGKDVRLQKDVAPMPETAESAGQRFSMSEDVQNDVAPTAEHEAIAPAPESAEIGPRMTRVKEAPIREDINPNLKQRKWVGTSTESDGVGRKILPDDLNQDLVEQCTTFGGSFNSIGCACVAGCCVCGR